MLSALSGRVQDGWDVGRAAAEHAGRHQAGWGQAAPAAAHRGVAVARRLERRHVDQVGQVGAGEAGGALGDGLRGGRAGRGGAPSGVGTAAARLCRPFARLRHAAVLPCWRQPHPAHPPAPPSPTQPPDLKVHIRGTRDALKMDLQYLAPPFHVGVGHHHVPVKPARPHQRLVQRLGEVGGGNHDDAWGAGGARDTAWLWGPEGGGESLRRLAHAVLRRLPRAGLRAAAGP